MTDELADIRQRLAAAGSEYAAADSARATARDNLEPVLIEALKAGIAPGEAVKLSHLSAATVRTSARVAGVEPATKRARVN